MEKKDLLKCTAGKFAKAKGCSRCTPFLDHIECD
jgi:hypothetical protein